jgi:hypothetical protein
MQQLEKEACDNAEVEHVLSKLSSEQLDKLALELSEDIHSVSQVKDNAKIAQDIQASLEKNPEASIKSATHKQQDSLAIFKSAEYIEGFLNQAQAEGVSIKKAVDLYDTVLFNVLDLAKTAEAESKHEQEETPTEEKAEHETGEEPLEKIKKIAYYKGVLDEALTSGVEAEQALSLIKDAGMREVFRKMYETAGRIGKSTKKVARKATDSLVGRVKPSNTSDLKSIEFLRGRAAELRKKSSLVSCDTDLQKTAGINPKALEKALRQLFGGAGKAAAKGAGKGAAKGATKGAGKGASKGARKGKSTGPKAHSSVRRSDAFLKDKAQLDIAREKGLPESAYEQALDELHTHYKVPKDPLPSSPPPRVIGDPKSPEQAEAFKRLNPLPADAPRANRGSGTTTNTQLEEAANARNQAIPPQTPPGPQPVYAGNAVSPEAQAEAKRMLEAAEAQRAAAEAQRAAQNAERSTAQVNAAHEANMTNSEREALLNAAQHKRDMAQQSLQNYAQQVEANRAYKSNLAAANAEAAKATQDLDLMQLQENIRNAGVENGKILGLSRREQNEIVKKLNQGNAPTTVDTFLQAFEGSTDPRMRGIRHNIAARLGRTGKQTADFIKENPVSSTALAGVGGLGLYHGAKQNPEDHPIYQQYQTPEDPTKYQ